MFRSTQKSQILSLEQKFKEYILGIDVKEIGRYKSKNSGYSPGLGIRMVLEDFQASGK